MLTPCCDTQHMKPWRENSANKCHLIFLCLDRSFYSSSHWCARNIAYQYKHIGVNCVILFSLINGVKLEWQVMLACRTLFFYSHAVWLDGLNNIQCRSLLVTLKVIRQKKKTVTRERSVQRRRSFFKESLEDFHSCCGHVICQTSPTASVGCHGLAEGGEFSL